MFEENLFQSLGAITKKTILFVQWEKNWETKEDKRRRVEEGAIVETR